MLKTIIRWLEKPEDTRPKRTVTRVTYNVRIYPTKHKRYHWMPAWCVTWKNQAGKRMAFEADSYDDALKQANEIAGPDCTVTTTKKV